MQRELDNAFRNRCCVLQLVACNRTFFCDRSKRNCFAGYDNDIYRNRYNRLVHRNRHCDNYRQSYARSYGHASYCDNLFGNIYDSDSFRSDELCLVAVCGTFFDNCQHGNRQSVDNNYLYGNRDDNRLFFHCDGHGNCQSDAGCNSFSCFGNTLQRKFDNAFRNGCCVLQLVTCYRTFFCDRRQRNCFTDHNDDLHCNGNFQWLYRNCNSDHHCQPYAGRNG